MKYPPTIYMSPRNVIARFNALIEKCGSDYVEHPSHFKVEKELLNVGKFYLGLFLHTGYDYYLRPWEDVAPDVDVRAINWGEPGKPAFQTDDIQVTEYEGHSDKIPAVIANKIKHQGSHGKEDRHLLVVIREHSGEKIYAVKVAKTVQKMKPSFQSIWLLMQSFEDDNIYRIIRISPTPQIVDIKFSIKDMAERQTPPDFIKLKRGANNDFLSEMYNYDLPLPKCK